MKSRLSQLGEHIQMETCVQEMGVLQSGQPPANGTGSVSAGLLGINEILGRTTVLCSRYSASLDVGPAGPTKVTKQAGDGSIRALSHPALSFTRLPSRPRSLSTLGKNLERIADGLGNGKSPEQILSSKQGIPPSPQ
jgi:hypothetical protein